MMQTMIHAAPHTCITPSIHLSRDPDCSLSHPSNCLTGEFVSVFMPTF
jgi:hypothetical protein